MVVEWTRDNIANFGCDLDRITISVQSAGGASVDYYNYAWTEDPVIAGEHRPYYSTWSHRLTVGVGSIAESGTATSFSNPAPLNNTAAFLSVASNLSCPATDARAALDSLRSKSFQDLFQAEKVGNPLQAILGEFGSTADEQGKFMSKPYFTGNYDYEAEFFKLLTAGTGTLTSRTRHGICSISLPSHVQRRTLRKFAQRLVYRLGSIDTMVRSRISD